MNGSAAIKKDALARIQEATDYAVQRNDDGATVGLFFDCVLSTVFQPIFSGKTREVVGHAAYARSQLHGENPLSPWKVLSLTEGDAPLVRFDRLCRVVHALNYFVAPPEKSWLLVAVQPRLLENVKDDHGRAFKRVLDIIGVETSRVVIEIPAEVNRNWKLLQHVTRNYKSHGYRIAINYGGTNENWLPELAALYPLFPDIVRLDRSILLRHGGAQPLLEAVHEFGSVALVHEIETQNQLVAAIRAGANFLQGRFLGAPTGKIEAGAFVSSIEAVETVEQVLLDGPFRRLSTRRHFPHASGGNNEPV